jgi:hypothetical protein
MTLFPFILIISPISPILPQIYNKLIKNSTTSQSPIHQIILSSIHIQIPKTIPILIKPLIQHFLITLLINLLTYQLIKLKISLNLNKLLDLSMIQTPLNLKHKIKLN